MTTQCADLLHAVKKLQTELAALRKRLAHAVGQEREDLRQRMFEALDELAAADHTYNAECTPHPAVTVEYPTDAFTIFPGETKAVPVKAVTALVPPPDVTIQYAPHGDPKFSAQPLTLSFQSGQPAAGILSVVCAGDTAPGFHYLRFDVKDAANDLLPSLTLVAVVVQLRPSQWEFVGPKNYGVIHTGASPVSGRVNAVAFDPRRRGIWYLGAAMGGIWKTTDFGDTWTPLSDRWKFLPVSSIAIDPAATDTIYVGTGDIPRRSYAMGVMKSIDGGLTWSAIGLGDLSVAAVSKVLVDPRSPNIVWAATFPPTPESSSTGQIWRSSNGGGTWSAASQLPSTPWLGIERAVSSAGALDRYYAVGEGVGAELWRTDNGGTNWTKLQTPLRTTMNNQPLVQQRPLIACSPIFPDNVYLFAPTDLRIYASKDAGMTWSNITDNFADRGNTTYTFCFACSYTGDPNTKTAQDVIYVGTYATYRSAPGGGQWQEVEGNVFGHADQHAIGVNPLDPNSVLLGNDGGIFNATFIPELGLTTVFSLNQSLGITQVYRADYSHDSRPAIIAGTQDVGTAATAGDTLNWSMVGGGDGGSCVINPRNTAVQYLQVNFFNDQIELNRTIDRWQTQSDIAHPFMKSEPRSLFAPMVLDPNNSRVLYLATNFLYRWDEPGAAEGGWTEHLGDQSLSSTEFVNAIAVAPSDSNRIYTGSSDNEVWMSTSGGRAWRRIDTGLPHSGGITSISVHPNDPSDILVALWKPGASVRRLWHCVNTMDGLIVWTDVTGRGRPNALPDFPANAIARDLIDPDRNWFVGTDIGVFFTSDGGFNWFDATGPLGLPNVAISALKVVAETRHIYAATFGRGIWQATL